MQGTEQYGRKKTHTERRPSLKPLSFPAEVCPGRKKKGAGKFVLPQPKAPDGVPKPELPASFSTGSSSSQLPDQQSSAMLNRVRFPKHSRFPHTSTALPPPHPTPTSCDNPQPLARPGSSEPPPLRPLLPSCPNCTPHSPPL